MASRTIDRIIRPCPETLPLEPCVDIGEKITRAIELMLSHDLNRIAVVRNRRAIGMVRLADALQDIGLEVPARS
jgi:CBS domain-containing protein